MLQDRILRPSAHGKRWTHQALANVSLSVRQGEWVGVYGPNGSGKTTLLRILAGILPPDSGTVECMGSLACFLGLNVGFHPERSVAENVYLHGLLHGLTAAEARAGIRDVITFAGVESHVRLPFKCLSMGMSLRTAFASVARISSDSYLFDEVLAVGDRAFQQQCKKHMRSLKEAGKTAVLVSHNLEEMRELCDRIVHVQQGVIIRTEQRDGRDQSQSAAS